MIATRRLRRFFPGKGLSSRAMFTSLGSMILLAWFGNAAVAADLSDVEELFRTGKYAECAKQAGEEIEGIGFRSEAWYLLKVRAEMARGKYEAALASLEGAFRRHPSSVTLRLLGREVYRYNGQDDDAANMLDMIETLVLGAPHRYGTPEGRVALGRFF